jgi:hypothetical protein
MCNISTLTINQLDDLLPWKTWKLNAVENLEAARRRQIYPCLPIIVALIEVPQGRAKAARAF